MCICVLTCVCVCVYVTRGANYFPLSLQRLYLVGSSTGGTTYNVLKIDRTEPYALKIHDDGIDYSLSELDQLLKMIHFGNKSYATRGVEQVQSSFGIVGMYSITENWGQSLK